MTDRSHGFTMMELVTVIIILGILSAIALPKLIDLTNETLDGSVQGISGALGSASAINYAAFVANSAKAGVQRLNASNVCTDAILGPFLVGGGASGSTNQNGNGNGNGNGNNGNGNGNANGNGNGGGNNGNGNGASVSQLMPNTNGVTYAVLTLPTGNCSGPSAGGSVVSCVLTATKGSVTRSATATVICPG